MEKTPRPPRAATQRWARADRAASTESCGLAELPLSGLRGLHPSIEQDVYHVLSWRGSLEARNTLGGTAPVQVQAQIERHHQRLQ